MYAHSLLCGLIDHFAIASWCTGEEADGEAMEAD